MKKGQNAFEFLTTYGWMILIVGVLVAGLAAVNFLDTGRFLPDSCKFASGFGCSDFKVATGNVVIDLENKFDDDVVIESLTIIRQDGSECTIPVTNVELEQGETKSFNVEGCNNGAIDSTFNGKVKVRYNIAGNIFTQLGELVTKIESSSTTSTSSTSTSTTSTSTSTTSTTSTSTSTSTSTTTTIITTHYLKVLRPVAAIDQARIEQISPDNGANDGTVDISENDARWLSVDGDNINVTAWNFTLPGGAAIMNISARCEIDFTNSDGGELGFSFNTGSGYSSWLCLQGVDAGGNYDCNLYSNGVDTVSEVNNIDLRCRMKDRFGPGAPGFSVDYIRILVGYGV